MRESSSGPISETVARTGCPSLPNTSHSVAGQAADAVADGERRLRHRPAHVDDLLDIVAPKGVPVARILLIGLGKLEKLDALDERAPD